MSTARLSSKGQLIIPKPVRKAHCWETGQELEVIDMEDGVLLKTKSPFRQTSMDDVLGSLPYSGAAKTVEQMKEAIGKGVQARRS
ncbi:MAG: AbrB/MazE/SpoVT family DNA-binding domain-containing protein [Mariprofundaceae bacterium]|nr:AbrB/MazE/SpoVT family DNA-binding domain-containing protein [Mariprofundaceae bacterium]